MDEFMRLTFSSWKQLTGIQVYCYEKDILVPLGKDSHILNNSQSQKYLCMNDQICHNAYPMNIL